MCETSHSWPFAGPAFNEGGPFGYTPKGGTGTAVRTLVRLAELTAAGDLG